MSSNAKRPGTPVKAGVPAGDPTTWAEHPNNLPQQAQQTPQQVSEPVGSCWPYQHLSRQGAEKTLAAHRRTLARALAILQNVDDHSPEEVGLARRRYDRYQKLVEYWQAILKRHPAQRPSGSR